MLVLLVFGGRYLYKEVKIIEGIKFRKIFLVVRLILDFIGKEWFLMVGIDTDMLLLFLGSFFIERRV